MRAARIESYGGPDAFTIEEVADPKPGPSDVLVEVHATSVNPVDYKIRSGSQRGAVRLRFPAILGMDVSGVVAAVGDRVTGFEVGDEVWSSPTHRRPGTYAELVAIDQSQIAHKPTSLSHNEAASLPLVALTAWECLVEKANVQSGQRVLIQAGAGGVGTFAVQLAKSLGAHVAATCSTRNVEFLGELGVDEIIDYKVSRFEEAEPFDVILESLGGDVFRRSLRAVRRGGYITSINSGLPAATARYGGYLGVVVTGLKILGNKIRARVQFGATMSMVVRRSSGDNLAKIATLIDHERISPVIAEVFPLERIADAHRAIESGRTRGKLVIELRSTEL